ncbi:hypothetical protein BDZ91DRAFT_748276 [Kalaharituber pfeilii]|nr:hypothetical protein BDZ91DRAFT_748276 [Kalaharituber pfeilii]
MAGTHGRTVTITSTEIAIGYDRKQDESFSLVSGSASGRGTPVSCASPPPGTMGARGYDGELRSPRNVIAEELQGSVVSIELAADEVRPGRRGTPSPLGASGQGDGVPLTNMGARKGTPGASSSPVLGVPVSSGASYGSYTAPYPISPVSHSRSPPPAPLTQEHLLQHQQQQQLQQQAGASPATARPAPKAQSSCSSSLSSFASTSLSTTDDGEDGSDSDDEYDDGLFTPGHVQGRHRPGPTHALPPKPKQHKSKTKQKPKARREAAGAGLGSEVHKRRKQQRPPSDVTSCITDGEHEDGLVTVGEAERMRAASMGMGNGGMGMGMGSLYADRGEGGRVAVDWGRPPPLPVGFGGKR